MTLFGLVALGLQLSIVLTVFTLGLEASWRDVRALLREPGQWLRVTLAMNVIMPALAVLAIQFVFVDLRAPVKIALVALSASPVPPLFPKRASKIPRSAHHTVSIVAISCGVALLAIPVTLELVALSLGRVATQGAPSIILQLFTRTLVPFAAAAAVQHWAPALARKLVRPIAIGAGVLLVLSLVPALLVMGKPMVALIGNGTLAAFTAFCAAGLLVGHLLGGPLESRRVLAMATACRHPGVAVAIAHATFPENRDVTPAILAYLLVSQLVTLPYLRLTARHAPSPAPTATPTPLEMPGGGGRAAAAADPP